jgi:orotate phosphoribosyltransferase
VIAMGVLEDELLFTPLDDRGKELGTLLLKYGYVRINKLDMNRSEKAEKTFNRHCDIDFSKIINDADMKTNIGRLVAEKIVNIYPDLKDKFDCIYGIPTWGELITEYVRNTLDTRWAHKTNAAIYKNPPVNPGEESKPEITRFTENDKRAIVVDDSLISGESLIKYCNTYLEKVPGGEIAGIFVLVDAGLMHDDKETVLQYVGRVLNTKVYPIASLDSIVQEYAGKVINGGNKVTTLDVSSLEKKEHPEPQIKDIDAKAYEEARNEYLSHYGKKISIKFASTTLLENYLTDEQKKEAEQEKK